MAFTRMLRNLIRDPDLGPRIVPIIPDEARTFGMDPLFNEVGIYSATGQRYDPVDSELVLKYREAIDGQVLEEGITEAGSAAGFQAAGTSYATHGFPVIPFYIFYSMFGFQRTGDQLWAAGDARARGFLMAATAGRTTLTGEGLQHDDGHSHVLAMTNPAVRQYDPTFAYELATIIRDGIERMHVKGEDLIYYISIYNENYAQAPKPEGVDEAHPPRHLPLRRRAEGEEPQRLEGDAEGPARGLRLDPPAGPRGAGAARRAARDRGRGLLGAVVPELRRDALAVDRWNRLHPAEKARVPYVATVLGAKGGPIVAATDWMKALPDLVRPWIDAPFVTLGTDGFGRSDTREALRAYFEIDPPSIAAAAVAALAKSGDITPEAAAEGDRRSSASTPRRSTRSRPDRWPRARRSSASVVGRRTR